MTMTKVVMNVHTRLDAYLYRFKCMVMHKKKGEHPSKMNWTIIYRHVLRDVYGMLKHQDVLERE